MSDRRSSWPRAGAHSVLGREWSGLGRAWLAGSLLALSAAGAALAGPAGPPRPTFNERLAVFHRHRLPPDVLVPPHLLGSQEDVDVLDYDLSLSLDVDAESIRGRCVVSFVPVSGVGGVSELVLDLMDDTLDVTSVTRLDLGQAAAFTHADDVLRIFLDPVVRTGSPAVQVAVEYAGRPIELPFGTLVFDQHGEPPVPLIFTLSEPYFARGWWPCKDRPDDKATLTMRVEAPEALTAVSNGRLLERAPSASRPGHVVTTWRESHPISTYLVSIAVTDYVPIRTEYVPRGGGNPMPVTHWAWPEIVDRAETHFQPTVPILEFFAENFHEYPFVDEKYDHAIIRLWGGMEHQTATSYGVEVVTAGPAYEFVIAHELAHQWWGNHVGPRSFESIWLNEGFATYSESLWEEETRGRVSYLSDMRGRDVMLNPPFADFRSTVHAPEVTSAEDYFAWDKVGATIYYKGAWVLHMLRWVMGQPSSDPEPDAIYALLGEWGRQHGGGSASTADFETLATTVARPLPFPPLDQWFFPQWLHREGRPHYRMGWTASPEGPTSTVTVYVRVEQAQAGDTFAMPIPLTFRMPGGAERTEVVWNDGRQADYDFVLADAPEAVTLDPRGWILKSVSSLDIDGDADGWPNWMDGCPGVPNPLQEDVDGETTQDACQPGLDYDQDGTLNEADCAPADGQAWERAEVLLLARHLSGKQAELTFEIREPTAQRPAVIDVIAGSLATLRTRRTFEGAAFCLAPDVAGDRHVDQSPVPPGGAWFLAIPVNGCEPLLPDGTSDPCR